jgi:hypothetical protein
VARCQSELERQHARIRQRRGAFFLHTSAF